ncbi:MAG: RING finger protein [Planctomycetota bacterium]
MGLHERPAEPPRDVARDDVAVAANRCPYCHTAVTAGDADGVACKGCLARHHQSCWDEAGRCSACGAEEALVSQVKPAQQEEPAPSARRQLRLIAAVTLSALLAMGAMFLSFAQKTYDADRPPPPAPAPEPPQVDPPQQAPDGTSAVALEQRSAVPVPGIEGLTVEAGDLHALRPSTFWLYHADGSSAKALLEPGQEIELELGAHRFRLRFARSTQRTFSDDSAVVWITPVE